jgi:uncharacterized protein YaaN involved in tellurite resistance
MNAIRNTSESDNDELTKSKEAIAQLRTMLEQSERTEKLQEMQLETLKKEIRDMERVSKRSEIDIEYLKNIMVKYFEVPDPAVRFSSNPSINLN